ncbi:MAG: hypothetical protein K5857_01275 [Lachnospiraceae bacterium]|nr:hypothetical protein [Lachnospiraceae bacterium]
MKFKGTALALTGALILGLVSPGTVYAVSDIAGDEYTDEISITVDDVMPSDMIGTDDADIVQSITQDSVGDSVDTISSEEEEADVILEDEKEDLRTPAEKIKSILDKKTVLAVLYLCESYPLKNSPSNDSYMCADIACGTTLCLKQAEFNEGTWWFYATVLDETERVSGYIPMDRFICIDEDYLKWEESLDRLEAEEGRPDKAANALSGKAMESIYMFPDSYRQKLIAVLNAHPNWVFVPQKTGISLDTAVTEELKNRDRNLVYKTAKAEYKDTQYDANWYRASRDCVAYYMNPSNFVGSDKSMFMFEQLTYNSSYHSLQGVQNVLSGTFMSGMIPGDDKTYAEAFYSIGSSLAVSPYHLAARVIQEQGQGTSPLISGKYSGYEGYYNYFNVNASGSSNAQIYKNGLSYAKQQGWDTRYKSLLGGAKFDSKNYILAGQDTPYLEKYNVVKKNYAHQYMQNVQAPETEASKVYSMYKSSGAINNPFVFKIPVYDGDKISPAPSLKPTFKVINEQGSNLYYNMGTAEANAVYSITASEGIRGISVAYAGKAQAIAAGLPYYDISYFDKDNGKFTLAPRGLDNKNYNRIKRAVSLEIDFEEYGYVTYNINVPVINRAPDIRVSQETVYAGIDNGTINLTYDSLPDDTVVTCNDDKMTLAFDLSARTIGFTYDEGFRGGSKKLTFTSEAFRAPIIRYASLRYIANPAAVFTLGQSGVINLVNRDASFVQLIPNMSNFKGMSIDRVQLAGEEAGLFTIDMLNKGDILPNGRSVTALNGAFVLKARQGAQIATNKVYKVNIISYLSNGLIIEKTINLRFVQAAARTYGSVSLMPLKDGETAGEYTVKTAGKDPGDSAIESVNLVEDKTSVSFEFDQNDGGSDPHVLSGMLKLKDPTLKKGRYRLTFAVTYKGHATNLQPARLYLVVDIK